MAVMLAIITLFGVRHAVGDAVRPVPCVRDENLRATRRAGHEYRSTTAWVGSVLPLLAAGG
eukprot:SAG11_NODE_4017_length_2105_cov_3.338983_2_plen_61_part_00